MPAEGPPAGLRTGRARARTVVIGDVDFDAPMRLRWLRVFVAAALVGGHVATLALAVWFLLWLFAPPVFAAMFVLLLAACVAAKVVVTGHWSGGVRGGLQVGAVVVLCSSYVVGAALAIARGVDALASQPAYATPRSTAITAFVIAAIAAAAIAAVIVSLPTSERRFLVKISAIVVLIGAAGAVGGAVAAASRDPCEAFEFDRSRWRAALGGPDSVGRMSDAERIARAIDRCRTVDGATRAMVRWLLGGSQSSKRTTWRWPLGNTHDLLGPGDGQDLFVEFGRTGRARSVHLTIP